MSFLRMYILIFLILLSTQGFAQNQLGNSETLRCHTMEVLELRKKADPGLDKRMIDFEKTIQRRIQQRRKWSLNQRNFEDTLIVIPVVVHVIHQGEDNETNVSVEQILSQVQVLNEDFRKMAGTPGFNDDTLGADINIEFCLAVTGPDGKPTNGITRTFKEDIGFQDDDKALAYWPSDQYLNIWVANTGGGVLGYAQFPDSTGLSGLDSPSMKFDSLTDGIVIHYVTFGRKIGTSIDPPYNMGRTGTHEVGHWLGLRHIWGDGGCSYDDYVDDTPISDGANTGCPVDEISCGSLDMISNYMDYTDDSCSNTFTLGQKERVRVVMEVGTRRLKLQESKGCVPAYQLDAGILGLKSPTNSECYTRFKQLEIYLRNYGADSLKSVQINYRINSSELSTYNWTGSLGSGEIETVALEIIQVKSDTSDFLIYTSNPNNNADDYSANDSINEQLIMDMDGTNFLQLQLRTDLSGNETTWTFLDENYQEISSGGPYFMFSNEDVSESYCLGNGCYYFVIFDMGGDGICCDSLWADYDGFYEIKDINGNVLYKGGEFTFTDTAKVCLEYTSVPEKQVTITNKIQIFPNPGDGNFYIKGLKAVWDGKTSLSVFNMLGEKVRFYIDNNLHGDLLKLDMSNNKKGIYIVKIDNAEINISKRVVIY